MCEEIAKGIHTEEREYHFKGILNFRDLGGYKAKDRKIVAWNRLYRSGELQFMTSRDFSRLKHEVRPVSVIDLRNESQGEGGGIGRLSEIGTRYFHVPVILGPLDENKSFGEVLLYIAEQKEFGRRVVDVLEILSDVNNYPLIIHCHTGKNRTGIMTAIILGMLGVGDEDITGDYMMSIPYIMKSVPFMEIIRNRLQNNPAVTALQKNESEYIWAVESKAIQFLLKSLKDKYGSVRDYVKAQGVDESLLNRLEKGLLTNPPGPSALSE